MRVALNTNKTLRVHTGGNDPTPSSDNIRWYKDSTEITAGTKYTLSESRTQLTIGVTGSEVAGIYEIRVMTAQGNSSTSINVSFPGKKDNELLVAMFHSRNFILNFKQVVLSQI